jgi:hypothetical protein
MSNLRFHNSIAAWKVKVNTTPLNEVWTIILCGSPFESGARGGVVVKALRYKPASRGFDSRWCHGIFQWHNTSGRTMALGSTQPLTEMSTRLFPGGKGCRCVRLTTLQPSCVVMKSGNLNFLEPSGPLQACNGTALPFYLLLFESTVWRIVQH